MKKHITLGEIDLLERKALSMDRRVMLGLNTGVILDGKLSENSRKERLEFSGTIFSTTPFRPMFTGDFHVPITSVMWAAVPDSHTDWQNYALADKA